MENFALALDFYAPGRSVVKSNVSIRLIAMRFALYLAASLFLAGLTTECRGEDFVCKGADGDGPTVSDRGYCKFFTAYRPQQSPTDIRILRSMGLSDTDGTSVRRFALVVGVGEYPNLDPESNALPSAEVDVRNLAKFFSADEQFDEVVVLNDKDATRSNIEYFLSVYFKKSSNLYSGRSQFLFAYSGHGFQSQNKGEGAQLALYNVSSFDDYEHTLGLGSLAQWLKDLASTNFSVLALINACYGGDVFGVAEGGMNPFAAGKPGGWALTAGAANDLVWSLGSPGAGSIFFDLIIDGIRTGKADSYGQKIVDQSGRIIQRESMVRLGALDGYLTGAIEDMGKNPKTGMPYSTPNIGVLQNKGGPQGGFFFLSPRYIAPPLPGETRAAVIGEAGSVSSVYGHPDLKVFNDPGDYSIRGIDVSSLDGQIDWEAVKSNGDRFAYIRAMSADGSPDSSFQTNWKGARQAGLSYGAYFTFDPCVAAQHQADQIIQIVSASADNMPIAVEVIAPTAKPDRDFTPEQCSENSAKSVLADLSNYIFKYYAKRPVLLGGSSIFDTIIDENFLKTPIWLHEVKERIPSVQLAGGNPWTFWQVEGSVSVGGKSVGLNKDVFFGTDSQFGSFIKGQENVALNASAAN